MSTLIEIKLPFLGSIEGDYDLFQYLIHSWNDDVLEIMVPNWVVHRFIVHEWEILHLHVALKIQDKFYTIGRVAKSIWNEELQSKVYTLQLIADTQRDYSAYIELSPKMEIKFDPKIDRSALLLKTIKHMKILKEGVKIYLKHLVPYLSRTTANPSLDFSLVRRMVFNEIAVRVEKNVEELRNLYNKLNDKRFDFINLEELRSFIVSEIDLDLLNLSLHEISHIPYVVAIKELEKQLYSNYNTVVLLYDTSF